jgi:hypothetical protein
MLLVTRLTITQVQGKSILKPVDTLMTTSELERWRRTGELFIPLLSLECDIVIEGECFEKEDCRMEGCNWNAEIWRLEIKHDDQSLPVDGLRLLRLWRSI